MGNQLIFILVFECSWLESKLYSDNEIQYIRYKELDIYSLVWIVSGKDFGIKSEDQ